MMLNRMLFRLYLIPCLLLISAFVSLWLFGNIIPSHLAQSDILLSLANTSYNLSPWVSSGLSIASLVTFALSSYKLWQWERCKGDFCTHCGGITVFKYGRYGPYFHCTACSKNQTYLR